MDCSLSTWPSISQFDDLTWMGLGDIDPLESLDRSFDFSCPPEEASFTTSDGWRCASPTTRAPFSDASVEVSPSKSADLDRVGFPGSLAAAARWDSINAVDLASVLDNFPAQNDSSMKGNEDVYSLYGESVVPQSGEHDVAGDVNAFMSDSVLELPDVSNGMLLSDDKSSIKDTTMISSDHASLSSAYQDVNHDGSMVEDDSSALANTSRPVSGCVSQTSMENSVVTIGPGNAHCVDYVDSGGDGSQVNVMQPPSGGCVTFQPVSLSGCMDSNQSSALMQHHGGIQQNMMIAWPSARPTLAKAHMFEREQVVQSPVHARDNYPATMLHQQARIAEVMSELKRNRAQASRARRLAASQRRARKYPLQKLIRMSSSPASARDRLDQSMSVSAPISQQPLQPGCQSQLPTFVPVVFQQSTCSAASQKLSTLTNTAQGTPCYHHHQHHLAASCEDNLVSPSGSSSLRAKQCDQNVSPLTTMPMPSLATCHAPHSVQSLDAVLLNQLQSIISKMNVETRLCIKDALYRLARSAKHRQSRHGNVSGSSVNASHSELEETDTNSIDRWIVNMLFCKQSTPLATSCQTHFSQASNHSTETTETNSSIQQWNSCGSSLSPKDQPFHHVVTGL